MQEQSFQEYGAAEWHILGRDGLYGDWDLNNYGESLETEWSSDEGALTMQPPTTSQGIYERIGKIEVNPKIILGKGASGTVFQGKFAGRDVAVKRVMAGTNVDREAELNIKCDDHPNVCRYMYMEKDRMGDAYLVLELCQGTLADYVEGNIEVERQDKDFLKDATQGLDHLHKLGIVHRDIKPSNILISRPQYDCATVKALIGDFGFSKELNKGHQSFSISEGWRGAHRWMAPEVLTGREGGTLRATAAVDVYALGCVFYYTLTKGQPLFNGEDEIEVMNNIKNGVKDLKALLPEEALTHILKTIDPQDRKRIQCSSPDSFTALALVTTMTSHDPEQRPPAEAVLKHPFFWSEKEKLAYIELVSDHLKILQGSTSSTCPILEDCKSDILGAPDADWGELIRRNHPDLDPVIKCLKRPRPNVRAKYNYKSVKCLLRMIRNLSHHLTSYPPEVQDALEGSSPKTLVSELFSGIFPRLVVLTWLVMSKEVEHEPSLKDYYHVWWRERAAEIYQSLTNGSGKSPYGTGMWPKYGLGLRQQASPVRPFRCTQEQPDDWSQPQVREFSLP